MDVGDLPGQGWTVVEERTWPTGQLDAASQKSRRARNAGGITVWRSLDQAETSRSFWTEVVPYASAADAELSLQQVPRFFVGEAGPDETIVSEQVITGQVVPGVTNTWLFEKAATGPVGDRVARFVAGIVEHILFIDSCSGQVESWTWADLIGLAAVHAERVGRSLGVTSESS